MQDIAAWIAPAATMVAAVMTASNLGARVTGWGFVVFLAGSIAWCAVAIASHQQNLLLTNGFLTLVNGIGIWRWLGRQARYEAGGAGATTRSASARVPDLFAAGRLNGAKVADPSGTTIGTIAEAMMRCSGASLAYVVIGVDGVGGVGETLHAVDPKALRFTDAGVTTRLTLADLRALPKLETDRWPVALEAPAKLAS